MRQVLCVGADETAPVPELGFQAPVDQRKLAFPDLTALRNDETWLLTWEGVLSNDSSQQFIDGPIVRQGQVIVDGTGMRVVEDSHPYCAMGVEPYDEVILRGCDPNATGQCGFGNTCYVHPSSTTGVGSCLPTAQVDTLSEPCKEFLVVAAPLRRRRRQERRAALDPARARAAHDAAHRVHVVGSVHADEDQTFRLAHNQNPKDDTAALDPSKNEVAHAWACEADPSRPGPNDAR